MDLVGKVMSLLLNMLSRLVIAFLPRSKHLLISWLQSPSAGIFLSGWGVGGSMGDVLSTFGSRGSSLILVGLLLSSCEGLHLTYFRELVFICSRRASL